MNRKIAIYLALVLFGGALAGCVTTRQSAQWPLFYCSEGPGPQHLWIARVPQPLDFYTSRIPTNQVPGWNYEFMNTGIESVTIRELGTMNGLRVVDAHLYLKDQYFTDMQMILQEVEPGGFLPVYVQVYNREIRAPGAEYAALKGSKMVVRTVINVAGTGHLREHYRITLSPNRDPVLAGPHY